MNENEITNIADNLDWGGRMDEMSGLPRNDWAKQLGGTMDAGELLKAMRPLVEKILILSGITSPPSQRNRVKECLARLEVQYKALEDGRDEAMRSWPSITQLHFRQMLEIRKTICLLNDFLAVHRTVCILEGK